MCTTFFIFENIALEIDYNCLYLYFLLSLLEAALQLTAYYLTAVTTTHSPLIRVSYDVYRLN